MKNKSSLKLDFFDYTVKAATGKSFFAKVLPRAEAVIMRRKGLIRLAGRVELSMVDDREIRKINKKYRSLDKPTDVVSLSYIDFKPFPGGNDPKDNLIGEIFISVETAFYNQDNRMVSKETATYIKK